MPVTVGDLKDQFGVPPRLCPILYCRRCGKESSANRADYFLLPTQHRFTCCGENMLLVKKRTVYKEVKS